MSFFDDDIVVQSRTPLSMVPQCSSCGIYKTCRSPKMPVYGKGEREILICGEAPGADEDSKNIPFIGKAGKRLRREIVSLGFDLERDCWVTNALICRPINNAKPTAKEIDYCRPNLITAIDKYQPKVIILLGGVAVKSVISWLWNEEAGEVSRWVGFKIPCQKPNAWVCPTYHPSFLERLQDDKGKSKEPIYDLWFKEHLRRAFKIKNRPWQELPNFKEQIQTYLDVDQACKAIKGFIERKKPVAFDYETNCKKPDNPESEIYACSISDGEITIAYPWMGDAIELTSKLLRNPEIPKLGQNIKFEERWTLAKLGHKVRGWKFDDMLGSHVIDNRTGITGIEFQAFAQLGQPSWAKKITPYLISGDKGGYALNRIKEAPLPDLLTYCGMDSLVEYHVAKKHMKRIGVELI